MKNIYEKYLTEGLDSKTKRRILSLIDNPQVEKLKVNGSEVNFNNKDGKLSIEYKDDLDELTIFLRDLFDEMKNKKATLEKKGNRYIANIWKK